MTQKLIEAIHASPLKLSLCICGAGTSVISLLTQVAGCSQTLLKAEVLYAHAATSIALDYCPAHVVTRNVAHQLAQHACKLSETAETQEQLLANNTYMKNKSSSAQSFASVHGNTRKKKEIFHLGVGATSSIQTNRVRHGADQVYVSVWKSINGESDCLPNERSESTVNNDNNDTNNVLLTDYHMSFPKTWSRQEQDDQVAYLILHAIAQAAKSFETDHVAETTHEQSKLEIFDLLLPMSANTQEQNANTNETFSVLRSMPEITSHSFSCDVESLIDKVLNKSVNYVMWNRYGEVRCDEESPYGSEASTELERKEETSHVRWTLPIKLLYPGSFRPLHWGHTELVRSASTALLRQFALQLERWEQEKDEQDVNTLSSSSSLSSSPEQQEEERKENEKEHHLYKQHGKLCLSKLKEQVHVTYEIAVDIVDKGKLSANEIAPRVLQLINEGKRVTVSNARLFVQKAQLFPGHGFIIGLDTARRVIDPQYYDPPTVAGMTHSLLRDIGQRGCYFVVGGRLVKDVERHTEVWEDWSSLSSHVPDDIQHLFIGLSEREFRVDVSSTELRARATAMASLVEPS